MIWDIITNKEAIAVNQAWAGESGTVFLNATEYFQIPYPSHPVSVPIWQQFSKKVYLLLILKSYCSWMTFLQPF